MENGLFCVTIFMENGLKKAFTKFVSFMSQVYYAQHIETSGISITHHKQRKTKLKLLDNGTDINSGALFENAVAEELRSKEYSLFYYNSKKKRGS